MRRQRRGYHNDREWEDVSLKSPSLSSPSPDDLPVMAEVLARVHTHYLMPIMVTTSIPQLSSDKSVSIFSPRPCPLLY